MDVESGVSESFPAIVERAFDNLTLERAGQLKGGVSADVYRLDVRDTAGRGSSIVLRIHGETHSGHPAGLEFELLQALFDAGVPVAEPLSLDTRRDIIPHDYLLMAFIQGSTAVPDVLADYFAAVADALVALHRTDIKSLPALPRRADPVPELFGFLPEDANWDALRSHLKTLNNTAWAGAPALLHGDFWPENLMWYDGSLAAILDWEDAAVGDPLSDVACCRLELRYIYGVEGMDKFTSAIEASMPLDRNRLALWQIYVAAAAHKYMSLWGLPAEKEAHMHREALRAMEESAALLLDGTAGNDA